MQNIVFVTSNKGKVASAQQYFQNIKLETYDYDLVEPRTDDIQEIAKAKVFQAFDLVKKPCIALDAGFFITGLNGFPRAFVNFSLQTLGLEGILRAMNGLEDRSCCFIECLAYYDGNEMKFFTCEHPGTISHQIQGADNPEKWSELWQIFIPSDSKDGKVLAEYSNEEIIERRNHIDSSLKQFASWYEHK